MICGFCADKNVTDCLNVILELLPPERMMVINSSHPRSMKRQALHDALRAASEAKGCTWNESGDDAMA